MHNSLQASFFPWFDTENIVSSFGPWALLVICGIIFAETGLLIGFLLPGDTLLFAVGLLTNTGAIGYPIWLVALLISLSAYVGGDVGYLIGRITGPKVFEKNESGFFSRKNVERTQKFFDKYGAFTVIIARFVPIVRTLTPVAAGISKLPYIRYSLYNLVGALLWGAGLVTLGYLLAEIPWVRDTALKYMDLVIIGVVFIAVVPTTWHYVKAWRKSRAKAAASAAAASEADASSATSSATGEADKATPDAKK